MTTTKRRRRSPADWMDLRPSELMDLTPSELMEMTFGDVMTQTPSEWLETAYGPAMAAYAPAMAAYAPSATAWQRPTQRRRGRDCGCDDRHEEPCPRCAPDPCQCECCIGDVDFAIYARVGERRVIPIVVENERRREKEIKLELSDWTTRGGKPAPVRTLLLHPRARSSWRLVVGHDHACRGDRRRQRRGCDVQAAQLPRLKPSATIGSCPTSTTAS